MKREKQKWDYLVERWSRDDVEQQRDLDESGELEWELVAVVVVNGETRAYYKRPR